MAELQQKRRTREAAVPFRESLHEALTDRLRTMILTQDLKPGHRINELALSEALGVSRTPMRESLKVLASEKLVTLFPYRGAVVADLDAGTVAHLFEVQAIIESQAAALACGRAGDEELLKFEAQQQRMLVAFRKGEKSRYFAINQALHGMLVAMAHNPCLVETHAAVMVQVERARYAALAIGDRWQQSVDQHIAILEALKERDAGRLSPLVADHVRQTGQTIVETLRRSASKPEETKA